ncbi:MAG: hypothetical protein HYS83_01395 [Candidatus Blackburnbacteria bacterium]|nr:hypothetical protein [Candidatus Blackburnbacteria bacterium]
MDEDIKKALESARALPDQALQAWEESRQINFPPRYSRVENLVICGMGASGLPGHVVTNLYPPKVPTVLVNDYHLPVWAGSKTLVFLSSYSGNTEETISCFQEAKAGGCLLTGATGGGRLAELLAAEGTPFYKYEPKHNPSGQPRMGLGYGLFGQLGILYKLGVLGGTNTLDIEVTQALEDLKGSQAPIEGRAQEIAQSAKGNLVLVLAGEHLAGNAHTFANQLNETSKSMAAWFSLPEANHHLLEGLKNPKVPVLAVFLGSSAYSAPIKKQLEITQDVVRENGHKTCVYKPSAISKLGEVIETLCLSGYSTPLLAEASGENPLVLPWVDYFKEKLR